MSMKIEDIIRLSELIGEMGNVKRATKLPNGENESDSHHGFSLALIAYQVCMVDCPELDVHKVVLFALVHDMLEIITGDENTMHYSVEQHAAKHAREQDAVKTFDKIFAAYPDLKQALYEYEKLDSQEAATVFVLDKACTTWTHWADGAANARAHNLHTRKDVETWAHQKRLNFEKRLKVMPPPRIFEIYEESFEALKGLYDA